MSILVSLWAGTLGFIYLSSYFEMSKQNEQMLRLHSQMYSVPAETEGITPPGMPFPGGDRDFDLGSSNSPVFRLSTFYTVAISHSGEIIEIKNDPPTVHTDDDLEKLARDIIEKGKERGTKNNLSFLRTDKDGYILVTFMDNTVVNENAMTLFRYTLIFGGIVLILFFFLSMFLAKIIVDPLEKSYRKQKQFISDAGHELKTPVSVVSANAELLSREIGDSQWLSNIQYENQRMGMLVAQLLELARTEDIAPKTERIDFSRLVAGEALPFESVAFENGLSLICNVSKDISVEGNSQQLKQIVSILLDNAVRHSSGNGEICLMLNKEHGHARLSVVNCGEEIPEEQRKKIFERFYRADTVRNGEDRHYGLGLAIAKAIAASHNGRIEVFCYNGLVEFRVQIPLA